MVDSVCGLTRGQVMSPWSDTADSGHYPGQLLNRSALTEFLKATKLRYLEVCIGYIAIIVEKNLYLTVSSSLVIGSILIFFILYPPLS